MRKIVISQGKGGTAKTTTSVNLSACLSNRDYRVLLIDTDTSNQASYCLGIKPDRGLAELIENKIDHSQALIEARRGLFILPGGRKLGEIKNFIAKKEFRPELTLSEALEPYEGQFDFIVLDTSPGWDVLTVNTLFYATEILCPISLEVLTIMGFAEFIKSIEPIKKYADIDIKYLLPTFLDKRTKRSGEILQQLQDLYRDRLCDPIRISVRLSECPGHGMTIFEYSPRSTGAIDYNALTERVLNGS